MYGYAAFWAFNIRKGLKIRLYRSQALGIGLVSISLAYFTFAIDGAVDSLVPQFGFLFYGPIGIFYAILPLFYWADVSLLAAQESDPLGRQYFHWKRLRLILWAFVAITELEVTISGILNLQQFIIPSIGPIFIFAALGIPLVAPAILLPSVTRRSKDLTLRNHLKWFGLAAIFLVLSFGMLLLAYAVLNAGDLVASGLQFACLVLSAYCLYRSSKAIVPIYTFAESVMEKKI